MNFPHALFVKDLAGQMAGQPLGAPESIYSVFHVHRGDTITSVGMPSRTERLTRAEQRVWDSFVATMGERRLASCVASSLTEDCKLGSAVPRFRKALLADVTNGDARIAYNRIFDRWLALGQAFGAGARSRLKFRVQAGEVTLDETDPDGGVRHKLGVFG